MERGFRSKLNSYDDAMNDYIKLDELSEDGTFTVPTKEDINMLELREYCKKCDQVNKLKTKLKEVRRENRKLKKEIAEMLKYAWYKEGENNVD